MEDREQIRRAYNIDKRSKRWIEQEYGHDRRTINKALQEAVPAQYEMSMPRPSPTLGTWHARIGELWDLNKTQPRKQRLTASRIFEVIKKEGYGGSSSNIRRHIRVTYKAQVRPQVYLLLEFDPGKDAQFDWGEARVIMAGGSDCGAVCAVAGLLLQTAVFVCLPDPAAGMFFWTG